MKINYNVIKSNRKTLAIMIKEGKIIVKAPLKTSSLAIEEFVRKHKQWIFEKISISETKYERFNSLFVGEEIMIYGLRYPITINVTDNKRTHFNGNTLKVAASAASANEKLRRNVKNYMIKFASIELEKKLNFISDKIGLGYANLKMTNAKGKWGSCDKNKSIRLNWRLIMLDTCLVDYVIVHELCHTMHLNHSKNYWELVSKFYPTYKNARKVLKEHSVITELYR